MTQGRTGVRCWNWTAFISITKKHSSQTQLHKYVPFIYMKLLAKCFPWDINKYPKLSVYKDYKKRF
jgi:hypothetical protein